MKQKILIVEDEFITANDLRIMLLNAGYNVCAIASSVDQARSLVTLHTPNWVLLDIMLKGSESGIILGNELAQHGIPFLYVSANTDAITLQAVKQTKPYGFLVKPFREWDLLVMLNIAQHRHTLETNAVTLPTTVPAARSAEALQKLIGNSDAFKKIIQLIHTVAVTDTSVLLTGETGTGKDQAARAIHAMSDRSNASMTVVNCAALPATLIESELFGHERGAFTGAIEKRIGKFEQADGGTVFLDEVGELSLEAQARLLRVLQEREIERVGGDTVVKIDVRVIAATNRNLDQEVAQGRFRLDLYYRLNIFPISLPALKHRRDDIGPLAEFFLKKYAAALNRPVPELSPQALQQLEQYHWPGNIRELEHCIERSILLAGDVINEIDMAPRMLHPGQQESARAKSFEEIEREHILHVLNLCHGKVSGANGAAKALNIAPATLYAKMYRLGIKKA